MTEKYTVKEIYEADFGCEGIPEGESLKVNITIENEEGLLETLFVEDAYLIQQKIDVGTVVIKETKENVTTLKKVIEVVAAIIQDGNKIFATQRGYGEFKGGWEFPGGKIEEGETPQEALKREIMEELDTKISVGKLLHTVEYDYPAFHLTMHCFWCTVQSGDLVLKEHEAAKWLTKATLNSVEWLPADEELVIMIQETLT